MKFPNYGVGMKISIEEIVDDHQLNANNSVSLRFNIDARGAGPDVKKLIQQGIEESLPMIVKVTQGTILGDARRGGAFARMKRI